MRRWMAGLAIVLAVMAASATTAVRAAPTTDQLRDMVLTPAELGAGFTISSEKPNTNPPGYSRLFTRQGISTEIVSDFLLATSLSPAESASIGARDFQNGQDASLASSGPLPLTGFGEGATEYILTGTQSGVPTIVVIASWRSSDVLVSFGAAALPGTQALPSSTAYEVTARHYAELQRDKLVAAQGTVTAPAPAPSPAPASGESIDLFLGCNNISLTWPTGTAPQNVADAVSPPEALSAIWRYDNAAARFVGFAPGFAQVSDLQSLRMLDAVFVCVNASATITRPNINGVPVSAPVSPQPTPSPSPAPAATRFTCADFLTQADAQKAYDADPVGLANLDADHDGFPCEDNPCPCSPFFAVTLSPPAPAPTPVPAVAPAPSSDSGATAICNDGTPSFSQHRRGTCSGHGGVRTWLKDVPA